MPGQDAGAESSPTSLIRSVQMAIEESRDLLNRTLRLGGLNQLPKVCLRLTLIDSTFLTG